MNTKTSDAVHHPAHYTNHPSGVECIQVAEHLNFCLGNAMKYIWRCDAKGDAVENLRKACWYIEREIARRQHYHEQQDKELYCGLCGKWDSKTVQGVCPSCEALLDEK